MKICIITVNYGNTTPTEKLIKSIEKCDKWNDIKIIIADNECSVSTVKSLKKIKKNSKVKIELYFFKKNYYYWPAIEKIISSVFNEKNYPDWILACNNDIVISDFNFFTYLFKKNIKIYTVIGPKILNSENIDLNPFLVNPLNASKILFWNVYFKSYYLSLIINFFKKIFYLPKKATSSNELVSVYAVHGSAIIFSKYFFKAGGTIDNKFKLYCEELSNAEIASKLGCKIFYDPKLKIIHSENSSTKKINRKKLFLMAKESHQYFLKEYFYK